MKLKLVNSLYFVVCLFALLLATSASAFADGGGPLLLIANAYIFTLGQIWIIGIESILINRYLENHTYKKALAITVTINFVSTILGAIALPLMFAVITGYLSSSLENVDKNLSDYIFAFGTWIAGDNSPKVELAKMMTIVGFLITYFLTVWIEYKVLIKYLNKSNVSIPKNLLSFTFKLNGVS